jgi:hypothetical protein
LVIDDVRSSCGCAGLERETDGLPARIESLRVLPGAEQALAIRAVVRGPVGGGIRHVVSFRTNDPGRPTASVEFLVAKIKGGVTSKPSNAVFGTVVTGTAARQVLEIHDEGLLQRRIDRVASSHPHLFQARLLSVTAGPGEVTPPTLIGRVEVTLQTQRPADLTGNVEVYLTDGNRPPDLIAVVGRVANLVEPTPSILLLPRRSANQLLYFGECCCRTAVDEPLELAVTEAPPDLAVQIIPTNDANAKTVRIAWDPRTVGDNELHSRTEVRLRARVGGRETDLTIAVVRRRTEGK